MQVSNLVPVSASGDSILNNFLPQSTQAEPVLMIDKNLPANSAALSWDTLDGEALRARLKELTEKCSSLEAENEHLRFLLDRYSSKSAKAPTNYTSIIHKSQHYINCRAAVDSIRERWCALHRGDPTFLTDTVHVQPQGIRFRTEHSAAALSSNVEELAVSS